jgi:hypothetical protein
LPLFHKDVFQTNLEGSFINGVTLRVMAKDKFPLLKLVLIEMFELWLQLEFFHGFLQSILRFGIPNFYIGDLLIIIRFIFLVKILFKFRRFKAE